MSEERLFIASNHKVNSLKLASVIDKVITAGYEDKLVYTDNEDREEKSNPGDSRIEFMKAIEYVARENINEAISFWDKIEVQELSKIDIQQAAAKILKKLPKMVDEVEKLLKKANFEVEVDGSGSVDDIIKKILSEAITGYIKGAALSERKELSNPKPIFSSENLIFASEDEAVQFLSDKLGKKIIIEE
jgi:hypothetical protein